MAIAKRIAEPIRVVSTKADTAIDRELTPLADYEDTRDPSLVHERPGERLTWFTLRPLKPEETAYCQGLGSGLAFYEAFVAACTGCSDPDALGPEAWADEGSGRHLRRSAMATLPDQVWRELGAVALRMGGLQPGEARRYGRPGGSQGTPTPPSDTTAESVDGRRPTPRGE